MIDAPSVAGVAVALWGVAELGRTGHRKWLVVAALAYSFGVLAKYPAAEAGVALALLIVALRGRRAMMDLALFGLIAGAVLVTYYLSARGPLSYFAGWRVSNNPTFGVTPAMVAFSQVWYGGLPVLLALGGWLACRRKKLGAALLVGAVPFPLYALLTGSSVGDTKHVVFGFLFILPLAGVLLGRLARWPAGAVVALMLAAGAGAFGVHQAALMDRGWVDLGPATDYLAAEAEPGQDFLIDNSWPFILRLTSENKVRSPWSVYDTYRVAHHQLPKSICQVDWFVSAQGAGTWPEHIRRKVAACGTFKKVYADGAPVTNIGRDLSFVTWDGSVEIYRNTRYGQPGEHVRFRVVALLAAVAAALWLPFAFTHVNSGALWLALPFLGANVLLACGLGLALVNNWHRSVPPAYTVPPGAEPVVGVIVPTAGESPDHVRPTVESVLLQDWPEDRAGGHGERRRRFRGDEGRNRRDRRRPPGLPHPLPPAPGPRVGRAQG